MSGVISRHDLGACPHQDGTCEIVGITNAFIDHGGGQWLGHWRACRAHEKIWYIQTSPSALSDAERDECDRQFQSGGYWAYEVCDGGLDIQVDEDTPEELRPF
jgi:hypothetical protein